MEKDHGNIFNQQNVCQNAFIIAYGVSKHLIYSMELSYKQNRVKVKEEMILNFLNGLAEKSNYMPNASEIHLPYTTKTMVFDMFMEHLKTNSLQDISFKYFIQVWKSKLFHIKVRKIQRFSKCNICTVVDEKIVKTRDEAMCVKFEKEET